VTVMVHTLSAPAGVSAEPWRRAYVDALPDNAFAVVHVRPDGTRSRHLPHHDAYGQVDLPHLRSALARLSQVHWEDPADAERARRHLRRTRGRSAPAGRSRGLRMAFDVDHPLARPLQSARER
jgi:hypothetical protein